MNKESFPVRPRRNRRKSLVDVLGPVEDLESYVKADWWKHLFNANYLKTDGDVVTDENITSREVDLIIEALSPSRESAILDLCCGQGRHALELARRGYHAVHGVDRSHYLINKARADNKNKGFNVIFKEGDARKIPFPNDTFDFIMLLGNSFGYFESVNDDILVLNEIVRSLKPSGRVLIDITDGDYMREHYQPRSWEWIDRNYFVCRERTISKDGQRLISREVITHVRKGVIADQFYAERLYNEEHLRALLEDRGFENITLVHELHTQSLRKQDLGMMDRRVMIVGNARKESSPPEIRRKTVTNIAVLMGDPRKSDIVKPNATFDSDDIHTIGELKKALAQLAAYQFTYFDNHDELLSRIQEIRRESDLVLNLCDEGFNNEPTRELHIPALLELLNIPYTGSPPQCLAYCYDKSLVRGIAEEMDIPVPRALFVNPGDTMFIELTLPFPVIVKPNFGDSSFGITGDSVCGNIEKLQNAITRIRDQFGYQHPILVEELLAGKDISVGIIGNPPNSYLVLPVIEEDYSLLPPHLPRICGYEAKWDPHSPYWQIKSIPANLPEAAERFLIASCSKLFERLGCRDYARFDWRLDRNGTPRLLEVNPNPGWCWDGHLAKMANLVDISYSGVFEKIIDAARERLKLV